jgi:hypothetical protein
MNMYYCKLYEGKNITRTVYKKADSVADVRSWLLSQPWPKGKWVIELA